MCRATLGFTLKGMRRGTEVGSSCAVDDGRFDRVSMYADEGRLVGSVAVVDKLPGVLIDRAY